MQANAPNGGLSPKMQAGYVIQPGTLGYIMNDGLDMQQQNSQTISATNVIQTACITSDVMISYFFLILIIIASFLCGAAVVFGILKLQKEAAQSSAQPSV